MRPVIDDELFGVVAEVDPLETDRLTDEAAGPVGADDVTGPDGPGQPRVTLLNLQLNVVLVLLEVHRFPPLVHLYGRLGPHRPVKCILQVGLVNLQAQVPPRLPLVVPVEVATC